MNEHESGQNVDTTAEAIGLPLVIPEGIRYNCQGCGRCCSGWSVGLTENDYSRVKDIDWGTLYPELAGQDLFVHRQKENAEGRMPYPHYTKARENGSCSFLVNNLCAIHSALGEAAKPGICRLFPYTYVPTPSGIFVGVTYNSMAAVRNLGELLTDQRKQLENNWLTVIEQERAIGKASEQTALAASSVKSTDLSLIYYPINLISGVPLLWSEYLLIEERMLKAVQSEQPNEIFYCFISLAEILAEAARIKTTGGDLSKIIDFKPEIEPWLKQSPGIFENLVLNMLCFRNFVWPNLRMQYNPMWKSSKKPHNQLTSVKDAISTILLGTIKLPNIGKTKIDYVSKHKLGVFSQEIDSFFRRYLYLKIFSKSFCGTAFGGLSMVAGLNNLTGNFLSSIIYAKAYAIKQQRAHIDIADLYEAYWHIDRESITLTQLGKEKAAFYDMGFSSPQLFNKLLAQMSLTMSG